MHSESPSREPTLPCALSGSKGSEKENNVACLLFFFTNLKMGFPGYLLPQIFLSIFLLFFPSSYNPLLLSFLSSSEVQRQLDQEQDHLDQSCGRVHWWDHSFYRFRNVSHSHTFSMAHAHKNENALTNPSELRHVGRHWLSALCQPSWSKVRNAWMAKYINTAATTRTAAVMKCRLWYSL